jgi:hypothetical protein
MLLHGRAPSRLLKIRPLRRRFLARRESGDGAAI